ncbi:hypothetical protein D082_24240 [Synechocystis sp. PCC 6714]|nr:hypothetical protein D082_24240 [Synechocystis sp. PCC 6714]
MAIHLHPWDLGAGDDFVQCPHSPVSKANPTDEFFPSTFSFFPCP